MEEIKKTNILTEYPVDVLINAILEFCKEKGFSFAAWRNPVSKTINLMIDFSSGTSIESINLEKSQPGFIFSPFNIAKDKLFLKKDLFVQWSSDVHLESSNSAFSDELLEYLSNSQNLKTPKPIVVKENLSDSLNFKSLVSQSIESIKSCEFMKVVPSRQKKLKCDHTLALGTHFIQLTTAYANAFVSIVYTPSTSTWVGATPELLISTTGNLFRTVALAGTQIYEPSKSLADVAWTQKEIEEQAMVSRYIINSFKKIRLREFEENGPKTVKAGNLIHLKTEFSVNMKETNFPELGTTMLELLHPTSAVCGMPLETAYSFLQKHEGYDREYFSGYLGPVNIDESTDLFVNLRCMKVDENEITLFAGAGVTEDSNPEKEWNETEMKMNTLLNVINNH
jgi:isochorismate synthase